MLTLNLWLRAYLNKACFVLFIELFENMISFSKLFRGLFANRSVFINIYIVLKYTNAYILKLTAYRIIQRIYNRIVTLLNLLYVEITRFQRSMIMNLLCMSFIIILTAYWFYTTVNIMKRSKKAQSNEMTQITYMLPCSFNDQLVFFLKSKVFSVHYYYKIYLVIW